MEESDSLKENEEKNNASFLKENVTENLRK